MVGGLLAVLALALAEGAGSSRLAVIRQAPDFALTTPAGETVKLGDLKDRVVLVSFVFTTCTGSCPMTTQRMARVQKELKGRGLSEAVRLVSITLDPVRDTPEVLGNYARSYEADPAVWSFLTGKPDEVGKVIKAWGMWVKPAANGQLDHPSRVFLVDPRGRVREIYNLDFLRPKWVAEDAALLLDEAK